MAGTFRKLPVLRQTAAAKIICCNSNDSVSYQYVPTLEPFELPQQDTQPMRIAYLINQDPGVSHTFIRREILALERDGVDVMRFALRGWDADIVDDRDRLEQQKTQYTLQNGLLVLILGLLAALRCMVLKRQAVCQLPPKCRS